MGAVGILPEPGIPFSPIGLSFGHRPHWPLAFRWGKTGNLVHVHTVLDKMRMGPDANGTPLLATGLMCDRKVAKHRQLVLPMSGCQGWGVDPTSGAIAATNVHVVWGE